MREFLIAGNWKMNMLPSQAKMFVQELSGTIDETLHQNPNIRTIVCPPFTHLSGVISELTSSEITVGAQNCYFKDNGAYTGEVSPSMIKAIGCSYCIVGHSERRSIFGETDEMIAQKVRALLAVNVTPIVCIGESLKERESGQTNIIVGKANPSCF
jgi:triosephosphate isomerase (TIM)